MLATTTRMTRADALAYALSIWFGCGLVPLAPGTAGSLGALPVLLLFRPWGTSYLLCAAVIVTVVGLWASHRTARLLGQKDPQVVCIDEVAGVLFTWAAAPSGWIGIIVGFALFRIADQLKPWPARLAEKKLPGGWGIMMDDLFAAAWSVVLLLGARKLGWLG
jgi:phosphatidylglycerophosphatase A